MARECPGYRLYLLRLPCTTVKAGGGVTAVASLATQGQPSDGTLMVGNVTPTILDTTAGFPRNVLGKVNQKDSPFFPD